MLSELCTKVPLLLSDLGSNDMSVMGHFRLNHEFSAYVSSTLKSGPSSKVLSFVSSMTITIANLPCSNPILGTLPLDLAI